MNVGIAETCITLKGLKGYSLGDRKLPVLDLISYDINKLAVIIYSHNKYPLISVPSFTSNSISSFCLNHQGNMFVTVHFTCFRAD